MWTQIRLLIQEQSGQSDLDLHCSSSNRLLKHFSTQQKQTTFAVIGSLRVKKIS